MGPRVATTGRVRNRGIEGEGLNCSQTWFVPTRTVWKRTTKLNKPSTVRSLLGKGRKGKEGHGHQGRSIPSPEPSVRPWCWPSLLSFFCSFPPSASFCFPFPPTPFAHSSFPCFFAFPPCFFASLFPCFLASLTLSELTARNRPHSPHSPSKLLIPPSQSSLSLSLAAISDFGHSKHAWPPFEDG